MGAFKRIDKDAFTDLLSIKSHFIVDHHKKISSREKRGKFDFLMTFFKMRELRNRTIQVPERPIQWLICSKTVQWHA